ncbi:MAG: IPT/TIG domain-containing protein [Acidobacteriota bacterium]
MKSNKIYFLTIALMAFSMMALLMIATGLHSLPAGAAQSRELRVANNLVTAGQNVGVVVELVALGNENALGFSLNFNPAIFSNPSVALGSSATGATLLTNTSQVASGRLGLAVALGAGQTFSAGTRQIVVVTFAVTASAPPGSTSISFGDLPISREISDANAGTLVPVIYSAGTISIVQPNPAPTLTSLNPTSATAGSSSLTLTVNGLDFIAGSTVRWNGIPRTTTFVSSTQVTATIPASDLFTSGTVTVTVVNPTPGGGTSGGLTFTINNPTPAITSLNPSAATAGGAAFTLTINGSGFVPTSSARWNGVARTTTVVSATQLTAAIPASDIATAGTASVVVNNPALGGGSSPAATFTINNPAPAITTLIPNSATAGGAGFTLTINGSGFVPTSTVWWNGGARTTTFVSATQLTVAVPANDIATAGTASVVVMNPTPGGGSSPAATFTINNPTPAITSLNPTSALVGGAAFTLTVNGSGFVNGSTVRWNGSARTTIFVSANQLTAQIPGSDIATTGTASITVVNSAPGGGTSNSVNFTISQAQNPVPTVTSISPLVAIAGGAAFTLTVNGTNFINGSSVQWNGSLRTTSFVSATQLTATIPGTDIATAGTANVTVSNPAPGGGVSASILFTINNPIPTISSLSPNSVTAGGAAFTLTINGANFVNGSTVWWNGSARTATFVSATQLTAQIPASDIATAGTANVVVMDPAPGGGSSSAATFTINNPSPAITSLNPASATAGGGAFTLTVNGSGFVAGSTVRWNGGARTTTFVSGTQLTAQIPASDIATAGTANVTISNPAPGGGTSNAVSFTISQVQNPIPTITSISPSNALAGGGAFTLTVNGTNFINGATVQWNNSARTTNFVGSTQLTAQIPASDIAAAGTASVNVVTPAPGGGTSNSLSFTINGTLASVSAASFLGSELASESIVAAFGVNLATSVEIANTLPLPTLLAGTKVSVRDSAGIERLSPLFFVAPSQVNYQMPPGTANGAATVTITSGDGKVSVGVSQIASVAPALFTANANGLGVPAATVFRLRANGTTADESLAQYDSTLMSFLPLPIDLGPEGDQVFVVLYGTGFRNNTGLPNVSVKIGGTDVEVLYAGAAPGFVGLDQCNARIPRSLIGRGQVDLVMAVNGKVANTVRISIK